MAVKRTSPFAPLSDLFVKLQKVYKDVYIFRGIYCIPGEEELASIVGDILCVLEPKYRDAVRELLPKKECIYIPSIKEFKEDLQKKVKEGILPTSYSDQSLMYGELLKTIDDVDDPSFEHCIDFLDKLESRIYKNDRIWKCIGENEEMVSTLFKEKRIFNLSIASITDEEGCQEYVTIAKQMLPLVSESNIGTSFIDRKSVV